MDLTRFARRLPRWCGLAGTLLLTAFLGGCGSGLYPVEGTIVWKDGSPAKELEGGFVVFDLAEKQTSARGMIQADGTFRLSTSKPNDGAMAGEYTVLIVEVGRKHLGGPDSSALAPGAMDARFSDPRTSGLTATVKPGPNKVTLTVERAPRR
jgi:hypothetical protein